MRGELTLRDIDYPNAWNFDRDPALYPAISDTDHKTTEVRLIEIGVDYRQSDELSWFGDLEIRENDNSDGRYDYDKSVITVGVQWETW